MKILRLIVTVVTVLLATPSSWAATYYTTKTGSNSHSCVQAQTEGTAKLTIAAGIGCLQPGDTLIVGDGTYAETLTASVAGGTSSNRITIRAKNRRLAVIAPGGAATRAVVVTTSYTTVQWFTINCNSTAGGDNSSCFSNNNTSTDGVWILDNDWANGPGGGIYGGGNSSFWRIEDNTISSMGLSGTYGLSNGMYINSLKNSSILRNEVTASECNAIRIGNSGTSGGDTTDNEVAYNYIHHNGDGYGGVGDCTSDAGGIMVAGQRNRIHNNIIAHQYRSGIWFYNLSSSNPDSDNVAYNNTIYDVGHYCIRVNAPHTNTIIRNNHLASCTLGATFDAGTSTVISSNRTAGVLTDCTPSTSDFTQKSGSLCIDAGANVGFPYNGSAPDIGAFETFTFSSCEVPFGAAGTIQLTFTSNANLLGDTLTTFTARRNGSDNALTGLPTKIGDTLLSFPVTTPYGGGDTVDWSWASGGFTDDARIGGTLNQPFLPVTNQSCTNNVGAAPTYSLSQVTFQYRGLYGSETTTDIRGSENVASYDVVVNGALRVRIAVTNAVSNAPSIGLVLRYAKNGGSVTPVPAEFGADGVAMCGNRYPNIGVSTGADTTNQLSTAGTFVPGAVVLEALAIPTIAGLNVGYKTEMEYCVTWDATATGTFTFYLYEQTGAPLAAHTAVPTVIIVPPRAGTGF